MPPPRLPLSVVVPCFNEELVLPALHARITAALRGSDYELILVNDGSRDATWAVMTRLAATDPNLVCVNLSRNHGHQVALTAGFSEARGDAVAVLDADLQDPPELVPDMLAALHREGADVVYGRRTSRAGEGWFKKLSAHVFYRGLGWLADAPIPADTGDFRVVSRRVVEHFLAMPERHRYVRGMISWIGFTQVPFDYKRDPRAAGESHYNLKRMVRFAWDAVTGFSVKPLTLSLRAGAACGVAALLCGAASGWWWAAGNGVPTLGLLAGLMLVIGGGQFVALGVIGEYLGRMYSEVRGRPLFVIDRVVRGRAADVSIRGAA